MRLRTRAEIGNSEYPRISIEWTRISENLGLGYSGEASIWTDKSTKEACTHKVSLLQTEPLGSIYVDLDSSDKGFSWKTGKFEGCGITERDLQWATQWAILAIEHRHRVAWASTVCSVGIKSDLRIWHFGSLGKTVCGTSYANICITDVRENVTCDICNLSKITEAR